jgi:uncharacterized protein YutE (UPF0331/DUF86 family)
MDWLQFSSSVIGSLAWPLAVVFLGILFRTQVRTLLEKMKSFKVPGGIEASFSEEAQQVKLQAQSAETKLPQPDLKALQIKREPREFVEWRSKHRESLERAMLGERPSAIVLGSWEKVEQIVRDLADLAGVRVPKEDGGMKNINACIEGLFQHGIITEELADVLHRLYLLRQSAAHNSFEPEVKAAQDYYATAQRVVSVLNEQLEQLLAL